MAVNSTHKDYDANAPVWWQPPDVLAGEDAVKAAGEKYLPRLDSQSDKEYAAYKARASFFGATARTLEEYLDLVFRLSIDVSHPLAAKVQSPSSLTSFASVQFQLLQSRPSQPLQPPG